MSTITITETEEVTQTGDADHAHIVKAEPGENAAAKVLSARVTGTPIEALCGFIWVPSKDPSKLPVCPVCKDIYDTYRAVFDGLNESPNQ
jgi:hypothetical protein